MLERRKEEYDQWVSRQIECWKLMSELVPKSADWTGVESYFTIVEGLNMKCIPCPHIGLISKWATSNLVPFVTNSPEQHLKNGKCRPRDMVYDYVINIIAGFVAHYKSAAVVFDQMDIDGKTWKKICTSNLLYLEEKLDNLGVMYYWGFEMMDSTDLPKEILVVSLYSSPNTADDIKKRLEKISLEYMPTMGIVSFCRKVSKTEQLKINSQTRFHKSQFEAGTVIDKLK